MKELILQKGEKIVCYVYENGKEVDKFTLKLNCNLQPIRDNQILGMKECIMQHSKVNASEK